MIFRPTQRLCTKIKAGPLPDAPLHDNPHADWSARLFIVDRAQYILVSHTTSFYSFLLPGRGITDEVEFLNRVLESMREYMIHDGLSLIFMNFIAPATGAATFCKPLSRSTTGSTNNMVFMAQAYMAEDGLSLIDTATKLNRVPFSALRYANPREGFMGLGV